MKFKNITLFAFAILSFHVSFAQDDLMKLIDENSGSKDYVLATFKTTRLINVHTIETVGKRTLDFRISHRFGNINSGSDNLWGLDGPANIRLGLEYSYDGRLMAGFGRSSFEKMFDGFLKFRWLRQTMDDKMPLAVTLFSGMYYTAQKDPNATANGFDKYQFRSDRLSYVFQAIIGRKFTRAFSLQVAPVFVHYNLVDKFRDKNDMYALSAAARIKITKSMSFTGEYSFRISENYSQEVFYNSMGIGWEIETGGHVFQVHFTNSFAIDENQFIPYTTTKWNNMGVRLGFNISRVFSL